MPSLFPLCQSCSVARAVETSMDPDGDSDGCYDDTAQEDMAEVIDLDEAEGGQCSLFFYYIKSRNAVMVVKVFQSLP